MYAVMGITGKVGGAVARTLLAKGEKVRGIVRNPQKAEEWQKQGAELFKADYDDVDEVKVYLTEVDERIYVTILDNGPGIPASVRRTLFDPFVTAGKPNGTGLGLTLARRIAEEHGGSVCLERSNRERTVFALSLTKNRSLPLEDLKSGRAGFEICSNGSANCSKIINNRDGRS